MRHPDHRLAELRRMLQDSHEDQTHDRVGTAGHSIHI